MSHVRTVLPLCSIAAIAVAAAAASAATSRPTLVAAEVSATNAHLSAADRAEKFAQMKGSAHAFFRATNHLFWRDLARSPLLFQYGGLVATRTFLAGDQHAGNFGVFDDDRGDLVYALNDFDQAVIGDYQLDLWRAAVSVVLVARENGLSRTQQTAALDAFTEAYLDAMATYANGDDETSTKHTAANAYGVLDELLTDAATRLGRAAMLEAWTVTTAATRRLAIGTNPDLAAVSPAIDADLRSRLASYRATLSGGGAALPASHFAVKSVAQRLHAGLGSLGARRYYVLIEGFTSSLADDRILDVKEQPPAAGLGYLEPAAASATMAVCGGDHARRAALAQKALGYRVDDLLGTMTLGDGRAYSVRERSPYKAELDTATLDTTTRMNNVAEQWGQILATHHARADRDWSSTIFPSSLDGTVDAMTDGDHAGVRALVRAVALDYADQVELDWAAFRAAF